MVSSEGELAVREPKFSGNKKVTMLQILQVCLLIRTTLLWTSRMSAVQSQVIHRPWLCPNSHLFDAQLTYFWNMFFCQTTRIYQPHM